MKKILLIFLFLPLLTNAQKTSWDVEASALGGFLMPHHVDILYLREAHIFAGELSLIKRTDGSKDWHHRFNFPRWGFSLNGFDLGSQYFGSGYAGKIFFDLPVTKSRIFFLKISIGAGWIEKPFDASDNVRNSAIGSHLNAALGIEAHLNLDLGEKLAFRPGVGIHHFSNGSMKVPNTGINLAMLSVGFLYRFNPSPLPELSIPEFKPTKSNILLGISGGLKERPPIGGKKYGVINVFGIYQKRITGKSSFGGELGVNYNETLQIANQNEKSEPLDSRDNYRFYVAGIYMLHFDPLSLRFSLGSYIAPRYTGDGMVFLRYHLVYDVHRFQIFAGLKSHYAKADNAEVGIGYRIR